MAEGFDAGLRFGESLQQDMVAVPIGPPQRFVVVGTPGFIARHGRPRHPRDLQALPCIRIRFPSGQYFRWEFAKRQHAVQVDVEGPLASDDLSFMVQAAQAGLGLAYTYEQYAQAALASGQLVTVLDDWCPTVPGFHLYHPSRKLMSAGLRAFIDHLRQPGAGDQTT